MVLPLSVSPTRQPTTQMGLWGVDVTLPDLATTTPEFHVPPSGSPAADAIGDVIVHAGGVSLSTRRGVERAEARVVDDPARLIVDVFVTPERSPAVGTRATDTPALADGPPAAAGPPALVASRAALRPAGEVRFGTEGRRHRTVLPLSRLPDAAPVVTSDSFTVEVTLPGLDAATAVEVPRRGTPTARAIREAVVHGGGIGLRTNVPVGAARAFLLDAPPRLVIDVQPGVVTTARAEPPSPARATATGPPVTQVAAPPHANVGATPAAAVSEIAPAEMPPNKSRPILMLASAARSAAAERGRGSHAVVMGEHAAPPGAAAATTVPAPGLHTTAGDGVRVASAASATTVPAGHGIVSAGGARRADARLQIDTYRGYALLWPNLDAPCYAAAEDSSAPDEPLAARRHALAARRMRPSVPIDRPVASGLPHDDIATADILPAFASPAAHVLAADLAFLDAADGPGDFADAEALYRRAAHLGSQFPDRARAMLMIGFSQLAYGLAPEAEGQFLWAADTAGEADPVARALALWAAGQAARAEGATSRAAEHLRRAVDADARGPGGCRARAGLAAVLAELERATEGLSVLADLRQLCAGASVSEPAVLLDHASVLAAAGRVTEAEEMLRALPDLDGPVLFRRWFLEADLAAARGATDVARGAYEAVRRRQGVPAPVSAEATIRLAALEDRADRPERARELLDEVMRTHRNPAVQARAGALAAEFLARRERQPEAIAHLHAVDAIGPAGFAAADAARARIFQAWIRDLGRRGEDGTILTVFYRYRGDGIARLLAPADVGRVAGAAAALGLSDLAAEILAPVHARLDDTARAEARRIIAGAALARGEDAYAARLTSPALGAVGAPATLAAIQRLRTQALLRLGRVDEAALLLTASRDRRALIDLGQAYLRGGGTAKAAETLRRAADAPETAADERLALQDGWLALAAQARTENDHGLEAEAVRAARTVVPATGSAGLRYRVAESAAHAAVPADAAEGYADAAVGESDALFARAAAAGAAYYHALDALGEQP
jgi:hypothetical protein